MPMDNKITTVILAMNNLLSVVEFQNLGDMGKQYVGFRDEFKSILSKFEPS